MGLKRDNQLEELQWLNLGGKINIRHLERVENPMDAKKANLSEKKNLAKLKLHWGSGYASKSGAQNKYERVLEALEPHSSLEKLEIYGFRGRRFPVWMSNSTLEKVVELRISFCKYCVRLPQLGELPHLRILSLMELPVEYIVEEDQVQKRNQSRSIQFPSLERLYLRYLPHLKGFSKERVMRSEAFRNLEQLHITDCSSFKLPSLSSLNKLKTLRCSSLALASLSKSWTLLLNFECR